MPCPAGLRCVCLFAESANNISSTWSRVKISPGPAVIRQPAAAAISQISIRHKDTDRSVNYHFSVPPADPEPLTRCPVRGLSASQL